MFVADLFGSKEAFTEKDLSESDKKLLREIAAQGVDKGSIGYADYGVNSIDRSLFRNIMDDRYNLKTLLGKAKVEVNEEVYDEPSLINANPSEAWICKIQLQ